MQELKRGVTLLIPGKVHKSAEVYYIALVGGLVSGAKGAVSPRKILDFRPFEVGSMQLARLTQVIGDLCIYLLLYII